MNDACIRQSETLVSNPIRSIIKITLTEMAVAHKEILQNL